MLKYKLKYKKVGVLPTWIVKSNVSREKHFLLMKVRGQGDPPAKLSQLCIQLA